ncbi:MAG: radical SAM protein [Planctomycetota bacterium]|nr:radical SAM protein [Planctomycetota bacterium]MDP6761994.1 radical SAM protein [Planctomycetota bacterium]
MTRRLPRHVFVELTNHCNLSCPLCLQPHHPRGRGHMTAAAFRPLADEIRHFADGLVLHLLGESLVNPDLFEIVSYAEAVGLNCTFTTNGELLDEHLEEIFASRLSAITVCIDGADAATHSSYRIGSDFERVRAAVVELCRQRRDRGLDRPHVTVQTLAMACNAEQHGRLREWTEEAGVDRFLLRPLHLGLGKAGGDPEELARAFIGAGARDLAEEEAAIGLCPSRRVCGELYRATVLWNGDVVPCGRGAWNAEGSFGNVFTDGGFAAVWRSPAHRAFVRAHLERRDSPCSVKSEMDGPPEEFDIEGPIRLGRDPRRGGGGLALSSPRAPTRGARAAPGPGAQTPPRSTRSRGAR